MKPKHRLALVAALAVFLSSPASGEETLKPISRLPIGELQTVLAELDGIRFTGSANFFTATRELPELNIETTYRIDRALPAIYSAECWFNWYGEGAMDLDFVEPFFRIAAIPFVGDANFPAFEKWWATDYGRPGASITLGENRFAFHQNPKTPRVIWLRIDRAPAATASR